MKSTHVALAAFSSVLVGCSPWHFPEPGARFTAPTALGTPLKLGGGVLRPLSLQLGATRARAIVSVNEGAGYDSNLAPVTAIDVAWYAVTPEGSVTSLAAPPIGPDHFWASAQADTLVATAGSTVLRLESSNTWFQEPVLPSTPDFVVQTASSQLLARTGAHAWVLSNGAWRELIVNGSGSAPSQLVLGPSDDSSIRLIWLEGTSLQVCTQRFDLGTLAPAGPRTCKLEGGTPFTLMGDVVSGSVDAFQVPFTGQNNANLVWAFSTESWHRGVTTTARTVLATPGLSELFMMPGALPAPQPLFRYTNGVGAGTVYSTDLLFKGCEPKTCRPEHTLFTFSSDISSAWLLSSTKADATRSLFIKHVALPLAVETCTPACAATQRCVRAVDDSLSCATDETALGASTGFPASARLQVVTAEQPNALPAVTVTQTLTGEALTVPSRVDGLGQVLELPPNTPVTLSFAITGYPPQRLSFVTANDNTLTDLGALTLVRGSHIGESTSHTPQVALVGSSLLVPVVAADGGATVSVVSEEGSGLHLAEHFVMSRTAQIVGSPDGGFVLIADGLDFALAHLESGQQAALATSAVNETWLPKALFSRDGTTAAVARSNSISLISLTIPPMEAFVVPGSASVPAQAVQISRDGRKVVAKRNTGYVVASKEGEIDLGANVTDVVMSGDGQYVYLVQTANGVSTISVRATVGQGSAAAVSSTASAYAVDLDGSTLLYATLVSPNHTQVFRYDPSSAVSTPVTQLVGVAGALPRAGAMWVNAFAGSYRLFFPSSSDTPRVVSGTPPTLVDARGQLHSTLGNATTVISEAGEQLLAAGPGVFRATATRRINSNHTIDTVSGTGVLQTSTFAPSSAAPVLAPLFSTMPMESLGAPCAVFTVPIRTVTVDAATAIATWSSAGDEVLCLP